MTFDTAKNSDVQHKPEHTDKIRKVYDKPTMTRIDTLDIQTGDMDVPESMNGLLEAS